MKESLLSQSLFALPLNEAIGATRETGFPAIELACIEPHFDIGTARRNPDTVAGRIESAGLRVSALALYTCFTEAHRLEEELAASETFLRLARLFNTRTVRLTPGGPSSAAATAAHWRCLQDALARLLPMAREAGVRLAFETHMRQLTDTLASSKRLLDIAGSDIVGLTLDFSNMSFAGEKMRDVFGEVGERIYNTHLKNGYIGADGGWHFRALDAGLTDYAEVLAMLRDARYDGYLTIECLGEEARREPTEAARRDLGILRRYLSQLGCGGVAGGSSCPSR